MTTRERVVAAIADYTAEHGFAPSVRELQVIVGLGSPATVQHHLDRLEADGLILREPLKQRTLRVVR